MSGPPRLSRMNLRARRDALYRSIVREALLLLDSRGSSVDEPALNRELYQCILEVIRRRSASGEHTVDVPPVFDGPNPPLRIEPSSEERKRPDFRWDLMDHAAPSVATCVIQFVIECKRLGSPISSRILNSLYVSTGVLRFINEDWAYGRNSASGAMVGYVQSLDFDKVLDEVNAEAARLGVPALVDREADHLAIRESAHILVRSFALSPFELVHLWIDMR
jgi:hypothetical protein